MFVLTNDLTQLQNVLNVAPMQSKGNRPQILLSKNGFQS